MRTLLNRVLIAATLGLAGQVAAAPPPSPMESHASVLHGVTVPDPWRWLEDSGSARVRAWYAAQNAHAEAALSHTALGEELAARISELYGSGTTRFAPQLAGGTLFYFEHTPPAAQPVLMAQPWPEGEARVVVDPNAMQGNVAITDVWPSPSGRYLAYGVAGGGAELTTIRILDVRAGKALRDTLPYAGGGTTAAGLAWDDDEGGFLYVRFPTPARGREVEQFRAALWHHRLGQRAGRDRVVFGQDYSPIAAWRFVAGGAGRLALLANVGDGSPAEVWLRRGQGVDSRFERVIDLAQNVREASWIGDRLVAVAFADAPRGRLLAVDAAGRVSDLLPQRTGAIQRVAPLADGFLLERSWGMDRWLEQYDAEARFVRRVALAEDAGVGDIAAEPGQGSALITWSRWGTPLRWSRLDAASGRLATVFEVKAPADYSKLRVHRIEGVSRDGTRIPVTVLALEGVTPDGRRPTVLYGYGGFGLGQAPRFIGSTLAWLERGGVFAYATLRGGNEFGEDWHAQGQKTAKQNVFDDFHAAMLALLDGGWTDREHLGIMGGSNGGLLVGVTLVQHPEDFRAGVGMVGIYDSLRHESEFTNGKYNVPEYGTIDDPAQFRATLAWSPLQNVRPGTRYPAFFMTTGVNDSRVAAWQSHKFAAALQHASASPHPILVLTRGDAGHGVGATFSQRVGDATLGILFFAQQLGLGSP